MPNFAVKFAIIASLLAPVLLPSVALSQTEASDTSLHKEAIEWLDITVAATEDSSLPRVLLIGDSITRLYYPKVQLELAGKANVARLSTSKSAGDPALSIEVAMLLKQYKFDFIQINNGMHGWGYTEGQYESGMSVLRGTIARYAPDAQLFVATTTPVRVKNSLNMLDPRTDRVRARNSIVLATFKTATKVDLFALMLEHPELYTADGIHPNAAGVDLEAKQVSSTLLKVMATKR